jgi:glycosyltransferase involved in cell wall biosynthesis
MLQGTHGKQRKEVAALNDWLAVEAKPEVVILTNALLSGVVPDFERRLRVPVFVTLQGDDIFLDALPQADRQKCVDLIRRNCANVAGFIATSRYYADHMAAYLGLPRERIHVVYPGINLTGHGGARAVRIEGSLTIGYFARISPEKGFHHLVEAFVRLRRMPGAPPARLRAGGWLGENAKAFFNEQVAQLRAAGLADDFEYVDAPTHADKVRFFQSIDVLSVPTTYREPKGLYVLEAWANGVPVVQPRHGTFPELIGETGGGILVDPDSPTALAEGLRLILEDHALRDRTGREGEAAVRERFTAGAMARGVVSVLEPATRLSTLPT